MLVEKSSNSGAMERWNVGTMKKSQKVKIEEKRKKKILARQRSTGARDAIKSGTPVVRLAHRRACLKKQHKVIYKKF